MPSFYNAISSVHSPAYVPCPYSNSKLNVVGIALKDIFMQYLQMGIYKWVSFSKVNSPV